jgi:hypothetical protein
VFLPSFSSPQPSPKERGFISSSYFLTPALSKREGVFILPSFSSPQPSPREREFYCGRYGFIQIFLIPNIENQKS